MAGCPDNDTRIPVQSPQVDPCRWLESDDREWWPKCLHGMQEARVDIRIPVRSSQVDPHRWPKSDGDERRPNGLHGMQEARVADSRSCRQMYLRSYTFSRKESLKEKTKKSLGKVRERIKGRRRRSIMRSSSRVKKYFSLNKVSCSSLLSMFRRLILSCTTKVNVA